MKHRCNHIGLDEITKFKKIQIEKFKPTTVNIRLRVIRTFLRYSQKKKLISDIPEINQIEVNNKPAYITEDQFKRIIELIDLYSDRFDPFFKDVFKMYLETGLRAKQPLLARLEDNWLIIPADTEGNKTKRDREIELTYDQLRIIQRMRAETHLQPAQRGKLKAIRKTHSTEYYSLKFRNLLKLAGIENRNLLSLRHSFALIDYYFNGKDIYGTARKLGHPDIKTTIDYYANFNERKIKKDFKSYVRSENSSIIYKMAVNS